MRRRLCWALSLCLLLVGCAEEMITSKYCNLPARFRFARVNQAPQLNAACNNLGQWCRVYATSSQFVFADTQGSTPVNIDRTEQASGFYLGLGGFLIGLPNQPEPGTDYPVVTCYDLACPNCYEESYVAKRMNLLTAGQAVCPRCERVYDLNNQGILAKGNPGKPLYRYRIVYSSINNLVLVNNTK